MRFLLIGPTVLRTSSKLSTYLTFRICQRSTEYSSCPATFRWTCRSPWETSFLARVSSTTYSRERSRKGSVQASVRRTDLWTCGGLPASRPRLHCSGEDVGG